MKVSSALVRDVIESCTKRGKEARYFFFLFFMFKD